MRNKISLCNLSTKKSVKLSQDANDSYSVNAASISLSATVCVCVCDSSLLSLVRYKTSQVTYVTMVPWEWERDATSSRGRYGNASSVTGYLKHD